MENEIVITIEVVILLSYMIFVKIRYDRNVKKLIKEQTGFIGIFPSKCLKLYDNWKKACDDGKISLDTIKKVRLICSDKMKAGSTVPVIIAVIGLLVAIFTTIYSISFDILSQSFSAELNLSKLTQKDVGSYLGMLKENSNEIINFFYSCILASIGVVGYSLYCKYSKWNSLKNICDEILNDR